jgi:hypothetical protein
MSKIEWPEDKIPFWAKRIPEDRWLPKLVADAHGQPAFIQVGVQPATEQIHDEAEADV